ncbi:MAG TPA: quinone oxidoreductase [Gemmatimonadaceae bacterium]|nr:quinone oxidoreductase [Gemmatimonadaceae bacterium]
MKAIRVHENGGPEVLRLERVEDPVPGPGEALVRVEATGVNFIEIYQRKGAYRIPLPWTPGEEGAGTVVSVGPGVTDLRAGDRVVSYNLKGSYAELAVADADRLIAVPDDVSTRDAAAVMLQGMTAHYLVTSVHALQPGETCLVHAAAGGVGLLLCQMAKRRNAIVIGTVSTEEKAALAREAGADEVILYTKQDFVTEVQRITGGKLVQVVYDSVGATTFMKSLQCLARRGMMASFGQSSGMVPPIDPLELLRHGSLFLTRPTLAHYAAARDELVWRAGDVLGWVRDGSLRVRIDRAVALGEAAEAHQALEDRRTTGKVLLVP